MLAVAVIVFREVLEAALIIGLVLAASAGVPRRGRYVAAGAVAGLAGAGVVAVFAAAIANALVGAGQELLTAAILLLAVAMLGWHNIWMARHGSALAASARDLGASVAEGSRPLTALAVVTGAAVLREGSETVLFVTGIAEAGQGSLAVVAGGAALGLAAGGAAGWILYRGLLQIPLRRLFAVTSWLVLLLAAGLAAQAAGMLVQANLIPALGDQLWNSSALLSETSLPGQVLHTLIGYVARPEGVQLLAYVLALAAIGLPMRALGRGDRRRAAARNLAAAGLIGGALFAGAAPARADLRVVWPVVDYRELEFEHNGLVSFGKPGSGFDNAQSYTDAVGYGILPFWQVELEGEMQAGPGQSLVMDAVTLENIFQLVEPGEYDYNFGFFAEFSHSVLRGQPGSVTAGPIVQKELPDLFGTSTVHTLNLFLTHDMGPSSGRATGLIYSWQSLLYVRPYVSPAVEFYGEIPDLGHARGFNQQQDLAGPVLVGQIGFGRWGTVKYQAGYLFGLTSTAPRGAVRWQVEYELAF